MKNIIVEMITKAENEQDFYLTKIAKNLIDELAGTYNAPFKLAEHWRGNCKRI